MSAAAAAFQFEPVVLGEALAGAASFGIAGNFAGHLEQAGEAADFADYRAAPESPQGVFPTWVPGCPAPLGVFPFSDQVAAWPEGGDPASLRLQIEPELALVFAADYAADGRLRALRPTHAAAYDDCSVRRAGARRISEKKNWGAASKGLSSTWARLPDDPWPALGDWSIRCQLERDGETCVYGVESPLAGYSLWGQALLDWLVDRFRSQTELGPLEDLAAHLRMAGTPRRLLVGIGATRYTPFGAATFLKPGDVSEVFVGPLSLRRRVTVLDGRAPAA